MIVREKIPAKINLTLDILGVEGKFHKLHSLVASINLFDTVTLIKRKDKRVTLRTTGYTIDCPTHDNNAVKAAVLFMKKFDTKGVNIIINKRIPVGGGLGGSSADIAAVLKGMKRLYAIDCDLHPLAEELGSDASYMLDGGYAVMSGRGTEVEKKNIDIPLYLLLISSVGSISTKECYNAFDKLKKKSKPCTDKSLELLQNGEIEEFSRTIKNDLEGAANVLMDLTLPRLVLNETGALTSLVSGSGPTVYGIYKTVAKRDLAYQKLVALFGKRLIKANTITNNQ